MTSSDRKDLYRFLEQCGVYPNEPKMVMDRASKEAFFEQRIAARKARQDKQKLDDHRLFFEQLVRERRDKQKLDDKKQVPQKDSEVLPTNNKALNWLLQQCGILDKNGHEVCFFPEDNLSLYRYFAHHICYDTYGFRHPPSTH